MAALLNVFLQEEAWIKVIEFHVELWPTRNKPPHMYIN